MQIYTRHIIYL